MEPNWRAVEDAIVHKARVACFPSEDWTGGYDDVVRKCLDRVMASFGLSLLLGFAYGWVPERREKSITHLEFECAFGRWKHLP